MALERKIGMNAAGKRLPTLRVLDIASPGYAIRGYQNERRNENVFIKAIGTHVEKGVEGWRSGSSVITLKTECRRLPGCLSSEPSGHYDHIHFHMFNGKFDLQQASEAFANMKRIVKEGGTVFFTADELCFLYLRNEDATASRVPRLWHVDRLLSENFSVIYRFYPPNDSLILSMNTPDAKRIGKMFGENDLTCSKDSARRFFSRFSEFAESLAQYFAIAVKGKS